MLGNPDYSTLAEHSNFIIMSPKKSDKIKSKQSIKSSRCSCPIHKKRKEAVAFETRELIDAPITFQWPNRAKRPRTRRIAVAALFYVPH